MKKLFFLCLVSISLISCATAKSDAKANIAAIVNCAKVDPANAAIGQAALVCIASAAAGQEVACLSDFAPVATWTLDEVQCVAKATGGK